MTARNSGYSFTHWLLITILGATVAGIILELVPINSPRVLGLEVASKPAAPAALKVVDIGFKRPGVISKVYVQFGDRVKQGDLLAEISSSDILVKFSEAQKQLQAERSKLGQLKRLAGQDAGGADTARLDNAKGALLTAQKNLLGILKDSYIKADDAVRGKFDQIFNKQFQVIVGTSYSQVATDLSSKRVSLEQLISSWHDLLSGADAREAMDTALSAESTLNQISDFADNVAILVNGQTADISSTLSLRNLKSDVFTARTNINLALRNVIAAEGIVKDAQYKLSQVEYDLASKSSKSGSESVTPADLELQEQRAADAQIRADRLSKEIEKTKLRSPVAGVITKVNAREGMKVTTAAIISIRPQDR